MLSSLLTKFCYYCCILNCIILQISQGVHYYINNCKYRLLGPYFFSFSLVHLFFFFVAAPLENPQLQDRRGVAVSQCHLSSGSGVPKAVAPTPSEGSFTSNPVIESSCDDRLDGSRTAVIRTVDHPITSTSAATTGTGGTTGAGGTSLILPDHPLGPQKHSKTITTSKCGSPLTESPMANSTICSTSTMLVTTTSDSGHSPLRDKSTSGNEVMTIKESSAPMSATTASSSREESTQCTSGSFSNQQTQISSSSSSYQQQPSTVEGAKAEEQKGVKR